MEEHSVIRQYKAILDSKKLDKGTTAFILASLTYRPGGREMWQERSLHSQKYKKCQIITGGWNILIKVKAGHVDTLGKRVMDKLRMVEGVENTLSCVVCETVKEANDVLM
ncbi:Lrp/AsnC family transcriptional regulator [Candidatus Bathyarchaeota archaeon]|nr:MAG: Lrp/AsnC family transcriptional regulator [Candidatus Bathyarchaeota archaeon]